MTIVGSNFGLTTGPYQGYNLDVPSTRYSEINGHTYAYALVLRAAGENGEEP